MHVNSGAVQLHDARTKGPLLQSWQCAVQVSRKELEHIQEGKVSLNNLLTKVTRITQVRGVICNLSSSCSAARLRMSCSMLHASKPAAAVNNRVHIAV